MSAPAAGDVRGFCQSRLGWKTEERLRWLWTELGSGVETGAREDERAAAGPTRAEAGVALSSREVGAGVEAAGVPSDPMRTSESGEHDRRRGEQGLRGWRRAPRTSLSPWT